MSPIASKYCLPLVTSLLLAVPAAALPVPDGCNVENARGNQASPLKIGTADFVPITHDDSLGFYVVYSGRVNPTNNVGIFIFELDGGEILIYGAGYGNHQVAMHNAHYDVTNVDALLRNCLGRDPSTTPIRFVSPHWHGDHINVEFIHELEAFGWPVVEILFHEDDASYIYSYYNWTATDEAKFTLLSHAPCHQEILGFSSPLGKIWFMARKGHAPGAIDAAIDVRNNPQDRFLVLGSVPGGECSTNPPGTRNKVKAHGNMLLATNPQVVPYGCGINSNGQLQKTSGVPIIGSQVVLSIDNPTGTLSQGSIPYLWVSPDPDPLAPCGTLLDLPGMAAPEEILVASTGGRSAHTTVGLPWDGPGTAADFPIYIPNDTGLVGKSFFYQGVLFDPFGADGARVVLTSALEIRIGD